jgi:hypothetical protein
LLRSAEAVQNKGGGRRLKNQALPAESHFRFLPAPARAEYRGSVLVEKHLIKAVKMVLFPAALGEISAQDRGKLGLIYDIDQSQLI